MANKTIVSNPYTFNINSNILFSTTINTVFPDKKTILYEADEWLNIKFINLTIPSGVNVVKVYYFAEIIELDPGITSSAYSNEINAHAVDVEDY